MEYLTDPYEIGKRFEEKRTAVGLSQSEVANRAGVCEKTYSKLERGNPQCTVKNLLKICKVLDTTPDEMYLSKYTQDLYTSRINALLESCPPQYHAILLKTIYVQVQGFLTLDNSEQ